MKQIPINSLLMLQMQYCFWGIMYNVGSMLAVRNTQQAWASTDALIGVVVMSLYGLLLSAGLINNLTLYRILMGLTVLVLGYGGFITHLLNYGQMELYQSVLTWLGAILINGSGLVLNLMAALGWFKCRNWN